MSHILFGFVICSGGLFLAVKLVDLPYMCCYFEWVFQITMIHYVNFVTDTWPLMWNCSPPKGDVHRGNATMPGMSQASSSNFSRIIPVWNSDLHGQCPLSLMVFGFFLVHCRQVFMRWCVVFRNYPLKTSWSSAVLWLRLHEFSFVRSKVSRLVHITAESMQAE